MLLRMACMGVCVTVLWCGEARCESALERRVAILEATVRDLRGTVARLERTVAKLQGPRSPTRASARRAKLDPNRVIEVRLVRKKYEPKIMMSYVWFDVEWHASGLDRKARRVDGVLRIVDGAGATRVSLNKEFTAPMSPGEKFDEERVGFEYNEKYRNDRWVKDTSINQMHGSFTVKSITYDDGTVKRY